MCRGFLNPRSSTDDEVHPRRIRMLDPIDPWFVSVQDMIRADFGWIESADRENALNLLSNIEQNPHWSTAKRHTTVESLQDELLSDWRPIVVLGAAAVSAVTVFGIILTL